MIHRIIRTCYQPVTLSSVCDPHWYDRPVVLVGGGPSIKGFDFNILKEKYYVIAINASIFDIPWADAGVSCDQIAISSWWLKFCNETTMPLHFVLSEPWIKNIEQPPTPNMNFYLKTQLDRSFKKTNERLVGATSGLGALNFAWLKGAKKIILLGFDYKSHNGVWHHNQHHYDFAYRQTDSNWERNAKRFNQIAEILKQDNVEVINTSLESRIDAFPKISIDRVLI